MADQIPWTVAAAAEELGISVRGVYNLLRRGRLVLQPVHGRARLITGASMSELLAMPPEERDGRRVRSRFPDWRPKS